MHRQNDRAGGYEIISRENKRALIAMSGGVDSSVAAYLTKQRGFDCVGVMMKLFNFDFESDFDADSEKTCCSFADSEDARSVAHSLDIDFHVCNFSSDFKSRVIDKFIESYQNGETPNPCIDCNKFMKFEKLTLRARQLEADYIVTGHYARIDYDKKTDKYILKKALDETKDQSYVLYSLTQEQLKRTLFPLGNLNKSQVREIAGSQGFINAKKRESQDICFVPGGDYAGFIEKYTGEIYESGDFIDARGNIIGRHNGLIRYTVGQRKGLGGTFGKPMYVLDKNKLNNTVTLCEESGL
ncbi:MAG: tRNA 2-thiouridine(34) synthase MnmA, partial [Oscillospiraceae bacterium]|nr:tRNA 2-thiouridine(34) synthase MnmA [Oscillospiraceae bacterium]